MATSTDFTAVKKRASENIFMYVYHTKDTYQVTTKCFKIKLDKLSRLKDKVIYAKPLTYNDWKLKVLKNRKKLSLTLCTCTDFFHSVKCYVMYDYDHIEMKPICAKSISGREHVIEIPPAMVNSPHNMYIKQDFFLCEIIVETGINYEISRPVAESKSSRFDETCSLMNEIFEKSEQEKLVVIDIQRALITNFPDFKINTNGDSVRCSKSFMAARSKYFLNYLNENPNAEEIYLDASYEAVSRLLQYVYFGSFYPKEIPTMLEVIKLAKKLQMKGLLEISLNFVKKSIDKSNANFIRKGGLDIGEESLVSAVDNFIESADNSK